ncbi:type II toxin-antitoxin system RelE/ParE family toxin [Pseudidiomarina sp. E22-M8]|uniref:type II toxin-antitoxin system RelE/ParE family toxin n=1 Tax=Pseudidiomarina sp. E22-M8 TaxID=3424768 RepID=UPI00403D2B47
MYKLSNLAAKDFAAIYAYTLKHFGSKKADRYLHDLDSVLRLLAEAPLIGRECAELGEEIRRHNHQKHAIFYRQRTSDIFVVRLLHQQMEPLKHFWGN